MPANVLAFPANVAKIRISVIMVSYRTGPALFEAITAAMEDQDVFELILVDNGNDIETRRKLSEWSARYARLRIIQGQGNIGFSKANNLGAGFALGEYLLFLNPDAIVREGTARQLAACGKGLQKPWITGAMLRLSNGHEQRGARRELLTPWSAVTSFTPLHKLPFFRSIHREKDPLPSGPAAMPVVSGACMMMDRISFDQVGGFDEDYFLHVEDIDLCRRAAEAGGEVYFVPTAEVVHYGSTSRVRRQTVEWEKTKGFIIYFRKHAKNGFEKLCVCLVSPFIIAAIMGRAWWLVIRSAILGR